MQDVQDVQPLKLFLQSCRSQETRNSYEILFQKYMDFVGENDLFLQNNPRLFYLSFQDVKLWNTYIKTRVT